MPISSYNAIENNNNINCIGNVQYHCIFISIVCIQKHLRGVVAGGGTSLTDAVLDGIEQLKSFYCRRLFIFKQEN